jgi:hypothetical protein
VQKQQQQQQHVSNSGLHPVAEYAHQGTLLFRMPATVGARVVAAAGPRWRFVRSTSHYRLAMAVLDRQR